MDLDDFMQNISSLNKAFDITNPYLKILAKLSNQLPFGIFQNCPEGKLEHVNRFLSELLRDEEEKQPEPEESLRQQIRKQVENCVASGQALSIMVKDFRNPFLLIRVFPIKDREGRIIKVGGWVEDLSSMINRPSSLEKKINELSILCELGKALQSTLNLEEILQIVLIGVTAGEGLGFNRAFLLLLNRSKTRLEGRMAIGPSSPEEAKRIWDFLSTRRRSLEEILLTYKQLQKKRDF